MRRLAVAYTLHERLGAEALLDVDMARLVAQHTLVRPQNSRLSFGVGNDTVKVVLRCRTRSHVCERVRRAATSRTKRALTIVFITLVHAAQSKQAKPVTIIYHRGTASKRLVAGTEYGVE